MSTNGNIGLRVEIAAPREEVFRYLTDPEHLKKWFCDYAEMETRTGGKIVFGVPHSFMSTYIEKEGRGIINQFNPPVLFEFSFLFNGTQSAMGFALDEREEDNAPVTTLTISQRNIPRDSLMMDALIVMVFNLTNLIEYGQPVYRLNYLNDIQDEIIERQIVVNKSATDIFRALTDENHLSMWFSDTVTKIDARIGGIYDVGWRNSRGQQVGPQTITEFEPDRLLGYSWSHDRDGGRKARWMLEPDGEKTIVKLTHEGFMPGRYNKDYAQGWHAYILTLKEYMEKGKRPFEILEGDWNY